MDKAVALECAKVCLLFKGVLDQTLTDVMGGASDTKRRFEMLIRQFAETNELGTIPFHISYLADNTLAIMHTDRIYNPLAFSVNLWNQIRFCIEAIAVDSDRGENSTVFFVDSNALNVLCSHFEKDLSRSYQNQKTSHLQP